jgi:hypothetical protein
MSLSHLPFISELPWLRYDAGSQFTPDQILELTFIRCTFEAVALEMGPLLNDYEWWVFAHQNGNARPQCLETQAKKPRVLFWFSDEFGHIPDHLTQAFYAVFKSYMPHNKGIKNLYHFPLGYNSSVEVFPVKPIAEREISVYFNGNLNRSRVRLYQALSPLFQHIPYAIAFRLLAVLKRVPRVLKLNFSHVFPQGFINFYVGFMKGNAASPSYSECLVNTKIALCPGGFVNPETFRHSEAMRAGAVIVSPQLPHKYVYEGSPIVQVKNWEEGLEVINRLLKDETELQARQEATRQWWDKVCSEGATAKHVVRSLAALSEPTHS